MRVVDGMIGYSDDGQHRQKLLPATIFFFIFSEDAMKKAARQLSFKYRNGL